LRKGLCPLSYRTSYMLYHMAVLSNRWIYVSRRETFSSNFY
jgi:hypothetical protein